MPREIQTGPGAWRAGNLDSTPSWYSRLPERILAEFEGVGDVEPATAARLPEEMRHRWQADLGPIRDALERGRGFVVVAAPERESSDRRRVLLYWLLGQALGRPVTQNVQGALLYDVRDTGQDVRYGARFSVTNAESSFHTDASFFDEVVDYVGLLCLRPARSGGLSQVVSGLAAYNELLSRDPQSLAPLYQPFHVDRRGGAREGESPTARFPVLSEHAGGLLFRYLRYWIEAGHDRAAEPLTREQREALDALDAVLADPALRAEFTLRPGEMLFFNNRWLLHNRTAFEDFPEPERRRHLVRLWLARAAEPEA